jgi:hypothetical protein
MRRVALLVGNSTFQPDSQIENLRFPQADVEALAEALRDSNIGRFDRVEPVLEKSKDDILRSFANLLKEERGATILFYYSGHGKISDAGRLYLAANDTNDGLLSITGVPFAHILEIREDFGCGRFLAVLDCCYAGYASDIVRGSKDEQLKAFAQGRGIFFLGAANATAVAREDAKLGHGILTAGIVSGLRSGEADVNNDGRITGPDLFAWCCDFATAHKSVRPVQVNRVEEDDLVIAFSPRRLSPEMIERVRATLIFCLERRIGDWICFGDISWIDNLSRSLL